MKIFSGIQPTGDKTLGNYIGGFRQYAQTQELGEAYFCIVDLHSITVEYDPQRPPRAHARPVRDARRDRARPAALDGLRTEPRDRARRGELALVGITSYGQLGRMTQFKEKAERREFVSAGLFTYPVLMAGDILLYQTDAVPIGDDQRQHLELARDVAERFNARFGETFVVPQGIFPEVGGADHGSPGADEADVDDERHAAGHGPPPRRARCDPQEVPLGADRLGPRDPARRRQAGDHEPRRDPRGRQRAGRPRRSSRRTMARATATSRATSATRSRNASRPSASATSSCGPTQASCGGCSSCGADRAREASAPTLAAMYERMGFVRLG